MFEYDELASNAVNVLDAYNFTEHLSRCKKMKHLSPYGIREYIEFESPFEVTEALEELSTDEFMEYLTVRYGVRWEEIIEYRMI